MNLHRALAGKRITRELLYFAIKVRIALRSWHKICPGCGLASISWGIKRSKILYLLKTCVSMRSGYESIA